MVPWIIHSLIHSLIHIHVISLRFTSFLFNPCHVSFHFHVILHCSFRFISFQVRNGFIQSCMHSFISVISVISFHSAPLHSKTISFHSIPCIHFMSCHFIFLCVARNLSLFLVHEFSLVHSLSFVHAFIWFHFISFPFSSTQCKSIQFIHSFTLSLNRSLSHS
jgi:hypothetical protein